MPAQHKMSTRRGLPAHGTRGSSHFDGCCPPSAATGTGRPCSATASSSTKTRYNETRVVPSSAEGACGAAVMLAMRHDGPRDRRSFRRRGGQRRAPHRPDRPARCRRGPRLGLDAGRRRDRHRADRDPADRTGRVSRLDRAGAHADRPHRSRGAGAGPGVPRPGAPVRGAVPRRRGARRADGGVGGLPHGGADQRGGRHPARAQRGRAGADPRPPQPDRQVPAGGAAARRQASGSWT